MTRRPDWDAARRRDLIAPPEPRPVGPINAPTERQLVYLAALAQQANEPKPVVLTRGQVHREIDRLRSKLKPL
jgi:hypothetical protein